MSVLEGVYEAEQKNYYILSSFWAELQPQQCVGEPAVVKEFDMHTCTLEVRLHTASIVVNTAVTGTAVTTACSATVGATTYTSHYRSKSIAACARCRQHCSG
jgi:hypothetical protein